MLLRFLQEFLVEILLEILLASTLGEILIGVSEEFLEVLQEEFLEKSLKESLEQILKESLQKSMEKSQQFQQKPIRHYWRNSKGIPQKISLVISFGIPLGIAAVNFPKIPPRILQDFLLESEKVVFLKFFQKFLQWFRQRCLLKNFFRNSSCNTAGIPKIICSGILAVSSIFSRKIIPASNYYSWESS